MKNTTTTGTNDSSVAACGIICPWLPNAYPHAALNRKTDTYTRLENGRNDEGLRRVQHGWRSAFANGGDHAVHSRANEQVRCSRAREIQHERRQKVQRVAHEHQSELHGVLRHEGGGDHHHAALRPQLDKRQTHKHREPYRSDAAERAAQRDKQRAVSHQPGAQHGQSYGEQPETRERPRVLAKHRLSIRRDRDYDGEPHPAVRGNLAPGREEEGDAGEDVRVQQMSRNQQQRERSAGCESSDLTEDRPPPRRMRYRVLRRASCFSFRLFVVYRNRFSSTSSVRTPLTLEYRDLPLTMKNRQIARGEKKARARDRWGLKGYRAVRTKLYQNGGRREVESGRMQEGTMNEQTKRAGLSRRGFLEAKRARAAAAWLWVGGLRAAGAGAQAVAEEGSQGAQRSIGWAPNRKSPRVTSSKRKTPTSSSSARARRVCAQPARR